MPANWARAAAVLLATAAVLVAAGLVAAAASDDVPAGNGRRAGDRVLDLAYSFGLVALGLALAAAVVLYVVGWHLKLKHGARPERHRLIRSLATLALALGAACVFVYLRREQIGFGLTGAQPGEAGAFPGVGETAAGSAENYEPHFATVPVLIVAGAALAGVLALWLAHRARRRRHGQGTAAAPPPSLDEVLADTLDDLRTEPDPRRAVIAAYARLERALAAAGHPRLRSDAPGEYLGRVLREADVSQVAVSRLTSLFARAKFSQHAIGEEMRGEAIEALEEVREDLRAAREALVPA